MLHAEAQLTFPSDVVVLLFLFLFFRVSGCFARAEGRLFLCECSLGRTPYRSPGPSTPHVHTPDLEK